MRAILLFAAAIVIIARDEDGADSLYSQQKQLFDSLVQELPADSLYEQQNALYNEVLVQDPNHQYLGGSNEDPGADIPFVSANPSRRRVGAGFGRRRAVDTTSPREAGRSVIGYRPYRQRVLSVDKVNDPVYEKDPNNTPESSPILRHKSEQDRSGMVPTSNRNSRTDPIAQDPGQKKDFAERVESQWRSEATKAAATNNAAYSSAATAAQKRETSREFNAFASAIIHHQSDVPTPQ
jgi:hypothetical protein